MITIAKLASSGPCSSGAPQSTQADVVRTICPIGRIRSMTPEAIAQWPQLVGSDDGRAGGAPLHKLAITANQLAGCGPPALAFG
jgi:hypothetical protein